MQRGNAARGRGDPDPDAYFLTLYMQNVLHYDALAIRLAFHPDTVLILAVGLHATPRLMTHTDTHPDHSSAGGGLLNTPLTATVTSGVDIVDAGAASGLTPSNSATRTNWSSSPRWPHPPRTPRLDPT